MTDTDCAASRPGESPPAEEPANKPERNIRAGYAKRRSITPANDAVVRLRHAAGSHHHPRSGSRAWVMRTLRRRHIRACVTPISETSVRITAITEMPA